MAAAEPLLWWSRRELDQLAALLTAPWTTWLGGWHGASTGISVRCLLAQDATQPRSWNAFAAAGRALAWWACVEEPDSVGTRLFGPERQVAVASIAGALEQRARLALRGRLAEALGLLNATGHDGEELARCEPWSGSVVVHLSSSSCSTRLLLNGACVGALLGSSTEQNSRQAASGVEDALSVVPIRASIEVTGCEISLGALQAIRCGDILRLPHPLEEPMSVTVQSRPVCMAFLGARDGLRAVELSPA